MTKALTRRGPLRRATSALAALTATATLLAACAGDEPDPDAAGETASASPTESDSAAADPTDDVTGATDGATDEPGEDADIITEPGALLKFGEAARVDYQPEDKKARSTTLEITVKAAQRARLSDFEGFNLDTAYKRKAHYYYVRVTLENVGDRRVGGDPVPLWGVSGANTLLPPVRLTSSFAKCPSKSIPERFRPENSFTTCLVFLSPDKGSLEGVSYRPTEDVAPIVWTGPVKGPAGKNAGND